MDGREALNPGTKLRFANREGGAVSYVVSREIGRGGSCIVYDASYTDNLGNDKLVRIKECYPHALHLTRGTDGTLSANEKEAALFEARKNEFIEAYQRNHNLFSLPVLTNSVNFTSDIYPGNGSVYIVSSFANSETLMEHKCASLKECVSLLVSTGKVLQQIHEAGYLYLDLKPENILTLHGSTAHVQLFDFDSMVSREALRDAIRNHDISAIRTSYTRGFAPLEQQTGKLKRLGPHSDVFSLGAVLFYALWGHTPDAFDCAAGAFYDFQSMAFSASYQDRLYRALTDFFHHTLASFTGDRYATMADAVAQLEIIAGLSDETRPWLYSTPLDAPTFFTGRETELTDLETLLRTSGQHVFNLHGMSGIGKSTLVREYLARHRSEYDAVLFLYDDGDGEAMLLNDRLIHINTVTRLAEESSEAYLSRKLDALKKLCADQNILVVVDNFTPEHLDGMAPLLSLEWTVLLISRVELPDGLYPSVGLEGLSLVHLARLFERYAHCDLESGADRAAFLTIARHVDGHTLLVELLARQIARNYLTITEAAALTQQYGFTHLSEGRVDYVRDHRTVRASLEVILRRLLEMDQYTGSERCVMKLLSLFDAPGIPAGLFRELSGIRSMDTINTLEDSGWLKVEHNNLYLHPVLREYVQGWPWSGNEDYLTSAEALMERLCTRIQPAGRTPDADKQFPEDYKFLLLLLNLARQVIDHIDVETPAGQRLRFRLAMDAPVDQDERMLRDILYLLEHPDYLDSDSILRLYQYAAALFFRLHYVDDAFDMMNAMEGYLSEHPSDHYLSVYHDTMGNMLHDVNEYDECRRQQDLAIEAAQRSHHPETERQLANCLLDKAMTLVDLNLEPDTCGRLLAEAMPLIRRCCGEYDSERYHALCIGAMYHARMTGNRSKALALLDEATRIADMARDSTMAYVDHLLDEVAIIHDELGNHDEAMAAIREAIRLCDENGDIPTYRRKRFEAYRLMAFIYSLMGDYVKSAEIYDEMENFREDALFDYGEDEPICPPDVREKARQQNNEA